MIQHILYDSTVLQFVCALEELAHVSKDPKACSEAESIKNKIEEFEFIVAVVFWYDILTQINVFSKILQQKTSNLSMALELIEKIIIWLCLLYTSPSPRD